MVQQLVFVVLDFELPGKDPIVVIEAIKRIPGVASAAPVEQVVSRLLYEGHHDRRKYHGTTTPGAMCGAIANWAIAPYGDPNEAALSCDAHLVSFLGGAVDRKDGIIGVEEFHVYPIAPGKRGAGCRHKVSETTQKM